MRLSLCVKIKQLRSWCFPWQADTTLHPSHWLSVCHWEKLQTKSQVVCVWESLSNALHLSAGISSSPSFLNTSQLNQSRTLKRSHAKHKSSCDSGNSYCNKFHSHLTHNWRVSLGDREKSKQVFLNPRFSNMCRICKTWHSQSEFKVMEANIQNIRLSLLSLSN